MEIKPYEKNAKKHPEGQIAKLAESFKRFGIKQPVVVDKAGVIVAGHGRFLAAQSLGWSEWRETSHSKKGDTFIPFIRAEELDDNEIKMYRLADNKLSESGFATELVIAELKELELAGIETNITGFELKDLEPLPSIDPNELDEKNQSFAGKNTKQIVLYFNDNEYQSTVDRLEDVREQLGVDNNTEALLGLLEFYEDNHSA